MRSVRDALHGSILPARQKSHACSRRQGRRVDVEREHSWVDILGYLECNIRSSQMSVPSSNQHFTQAPGQTHFGALPVYCLPFDQLETILSGKSRNPAEMKATIVALTILASSTSVDSAVPLRKRQDMYSAVYEARDAMAPAGMPCTGNRLGVVSDSVDSEGGLLGVRCKMLLPTNCIY